MCLIVKCKVTNVFISYLILLFSTFKQTDKQFKQTDGFSDRQVNIENKSNQNIIHEKDNNFGIKTRLDRVERI